ncbi:MAG: hypothetical protein IPJ18_20255 [Betaproteobacteria bacterium]|nr:hypothetical protein [Betaproteobacteria bacterium]
MTKIDVIIRPKHGPADSQSVYQFKDLDDAGGFISDVFKKFSATTSQPPWPWMASQWIGRSKASRSWSKDLSCNDAPLLLIQHCPHNCPPHQPAP